MCSLNYKCLSAKRPKATHLPATNWSGFVDGTSLNCADYSELKVAFRILICITSFLFPFLCCRWAPSPFLTGIKLVAYRLPPTPPLTSQNPLTSHHLPHSSPMLPALHFPPSTPGRALAYTLAPKRHQCQQPAAQHLPRPDLPRRNAFLHSRALWTSLRETLGDNYLYSPVIPTPAFLLQKLVLPSALTMDIWP